MASDSTEPRRAEPVDLVRARAAIGKLRGRIGELQQFDPQRIDNRGDPIIRALSEGVDETLREVFGADTPDYERYGAAKALDKAPFLLNGTPMALVRDGLEQGKAVAISLLQQAVDALEEQITDRTSALKPPPAPPEDAPEVAGAAVEPPPAPAPARPAAAEPAAAAAPGDTREILVVPGPDTVASGEVARFLRKAGFSAVILHEHGNIARTDIEKLDRQAAVGFVAVLLPAAGEGAAQPRRRETVNAELFYFLGKLGRGKVCVLTQSENDAPPISGVSCAPYDPYEGWQKFLLRALEEAGYSIDWGKALR